MSCSYISYSALGLLPSPSEWAPAVGAAAIAGAFALVSVVAATVRAPRDRRRELYSRAFADAMSWQEGLYRVRRRDNTSEQDLLLTARFHDLQERIDHHRAWLASESIPLARSYCRFVSHVKGECQPLITAAWADPGKPPSSAGHASSTHPRGIDEQASRFLFDVRLHLWSALFIPTLMLRHRNQKTPPHPPSPPTPAPTAAGPPTP